MIEFGDDKKKKNYNISSSAQFKQYVNSMNEMHATPMEQYPGQFQQTGMMPIRKSMSPKEARMMQAQQIRMMQMQQDMQQGIPQGFVGVPEYDPYHRRPRF